MLFVQLHPEVNLITLKVKKNLLFILFNHRFPSQLKPTTSDSIPIKIRAI